MNNTHMNYSAPFHLILKKNILNTTCIIHLIKIKNSQFRFFYLNFDIKEMNAVKIVYIARENVTDPEKQKRIPITSNHTIQKFIKECKALLDLDSIKALILALGNLRNC